MAKLSVKLRSIGFGGDSSGIAFWCPGCEEMHAICTDAAGGGIKPVWQWDGNVDAPTVTPSINVAGKRRLTDDEHRRVMAGELVVVPDRRCHSFLHAGTIEFLPDCTHAHAGHTAPLPDLPD